MNTVNLLAALARECPKGVNFDPLAVRLLKKKIPLEDRQIEALKSTMFQVQNGMWFSSEMILPQDSLLEARKQVEGWLGRYGCFSVDRLLEDFYDALRHISTPRDCAAFLAHLGFEVSSFDAECYFCISPQISLDNALTEISKKINQLIEKAGGIITFHEIHQKLPNITSSSLENIRSRFLQNIYSTEINKTICWCNIEAITLPDDFSSVITDIVDTLLILKEKINCKNLEFAINLFYRSRFREEYALLDNNTFLRVCTEHYHGKNTPFSNPKKPSKSNVSAPTSRSRGPNTRFKSLGVPLGAKLIFTRNDQVTCTVLDDSNQVEYEGKPWAISSLAMDLLGLSSANGFSFFSYEGETLWARRIRLAREDVQSKVHSVVMASTSESQEEKSGIVGLSGKMLSASTWRAFRRDGTSSRVAEWARRIDKGESVEQIAQEMGYAVPTIKGMLSNHHLYFKVCELNGMSPEDSTDV